MLLSACRDYGEFIVAERQRVDNDELPALSDMDLRDINLEFAVYSEAHARILPEANWPNPIGDLMDRTKWQNGGELPEDFDLPLPDACLYVTSNAQSAQFRRVEIGNRSILLATYGIPIPESERSEEDRFFGRQKRPVLAIIDENTWTRTNFEFDSVGFDNLQVLDDQVVLLSRTRHSINFRSLRWIANQPALSDPIELVKTDNSIRKHVSRFVDTETIALAWLTRSNSPSESEHLIYYQMIDVTNPGQRNTNLLSATASSSLLAMNIHDHEVWIHWVDSRFGKRGFMSKNMRKIMSANIASEGVKQNLLAINLPFDDSDTAFIPVLVWTNNTYEFFSWGKTAEGLWQEAPLQFAYLNVEETTLNLAKQAVNYYEIIAEATRQELDYQRNRPIPSLPVPNSAECDNWEESLNRHFEQGPLRVLRPDGSLQPLGDLPDHKDNDSR